MNTENPTDTLHRRFKSLSGQTNRQYAYAVVYGGHGADQASAFCAFVMANGLNKSDPADNLALWYEDVDQH